MIYFIEQMYISVLDHSATTFARQFCYILETKFWKQIVKNAV